MASVDQLANDICEALFKWLPETVRAHNLDAPVYCLFVWYHDFSVDDPTPVYGLPTESYRDACIARSKRTASESIWTPQQACEEPPFPGAPVLIEKCCVVGLQSKEIYDRLSPRIFGPISRRLWKLRNLHKRNMDIEMLALNPLRSSLHSLVRKLNGDVRWNDLCPVTDDFVVLPSDYIGAWMEYDIGASLSDPMLERLRSSRFSPFNCT